MENEKQMQLQKHYAEMQFLQEQMKRLQQQLEMLAQQKLATQSSLTTLSEIQGEEDKELLVPVADGVFFKAKLKNTKECVVTLNGNIAVKKPVEDAQGILQKQFTQLEEAEAAMMEQMQKFYTLMKSAEEKLQQLAQ